MAPLREMVLYYNPDQSPYAAKLKGVLVRMGIRIKNIAPEQTEKLVGTLAGLPGYAEGEELWKQVIAQKESREADEGAGQFRGQADSDTADQGSIPQIPEEILVMKNFTGRRIDALLLNLRKAGVPKIALKAVITEQNSRWTFYQLYEEIKKEHLAVTAAETEKEKG